MRFPFQWAQLVRLRSLRHIFVLVVNRLLDIRLFNHTNILYFFLLRILHLVLIDAEGQPIFWFQERRRQPVAGVVNYANGGVHFISEDASDFFVLLFDLLVFLVLVDLLNL
jgi:hypothetical protein